jgi:hypothetical protein
VNELAHDSSFTDSSVVIDNDMHAYLRDFVGRRRTLNVADAGIETYTAN